MCGVGRRKRTAVATRSGADVITVAGAGRTLVPRSDN